MSLSDRPRHDRAPAPRDALADGCWALMPLKAPGLGKQRLARWLGPAQRQGLVDHMRDRVLSALHGCTDIAGVAVTCPQAVGADVLWIPDTRGELNAALRDAAAQLAQRGVRELLVLHADLPWLAADDIAELIASGRRDGLAFAADRHQRGTNALYTRLPQRIDFAFGPDSLARHLAQAGALGLQVAPLNRPGLAYDVDEPDDLQHLGPWTRPPGTPDGPIAAAGVATPGHPPPPDPPTPAPRSLPWHPPHPARTAKSI